MAKEAAVFLLRRWSLPNPEYYTLRYADGPQLYITEQVSTGTHSLSSEQPEAVVPMALRGLPLTGVRAAPWAGQGASALTLL